MGGWGANDNCGIGIEGGRTAEQCHSLWHYCADSRTREARRGGARAARILNCPDSLWTIAQQAVAQLPGTRRHNLSNKDGSQVCI